MTSGPPNDRGPAPDERRSTLSDMRAAFVRGYRGAVSPQPDRGVAHDGRAEPLTDGPPPELAATRAVTSTASPGTPIAEPAADPGGSPRGDTPGGPPGGRRVREAMVRRAALITAVLAVLLAAAQIPPVARFIDQSTHRRPEPYYEIFFDSLPAARSADGAPRTVAGAFTMVDHGGVTRNVPGPVLTLESGGRTEHVTLRPWSVSRGTYAFRFDEPLPAASGPWRVRIDVEGTPYRLSYGSRPPRGATP